jgi:hypothetical protein
MPGTGILSAMAICLYVPSDATDSTASGTWCTKHLDLWNVWISTAALPGEHGISLAVPNIAASFEDGVSWRKISIALIFPEREPSKVMSVGVTRSSATPNALGSVGGPHFQPSVDQACLKMGLSAVFEVAPLKPKPGLNGPPAKVKSPTHSTSLRAGSVSPKYGETRMRHPLDSEGTTARFQSSFSYGARADSVDLSPPEKRVGCGR